MQANSEEARFDLARKLTTIDAHQRHSFLEATVSAMDAHLRYYQRSFEVGHQHLISGHEYMPALHASAEDTSLSNSRLCHIRMPYLAKVHTACRQMGPSCVLRDQTACIKLSHM